MKISQFIEMASFLVLLFWFITVESWNPLKYALAALILLLVIDFVKDRKFFWNQNKSYNAKRKSRKCRG